MHLSYDYKSHLFLCIVALLSWISRSTLYIREVDFVTKLADIVSKFLSFVF